jgi:adenylate cyclase
MNTIDMTTTEQSSSLSAGEEIGTETTYKFNGERFKNGRNGMFETTAQQIINIATIKPVILFIDDLHWADTGALHLLHYLARTIKNQQVAIIGAYRPEDLADTTKIHPLQVLLDRMIPEKLVKQINLERFNNLETSDMIQSLLHDTKFPEEFSEYIHSETEGNPFFIEEVLHSMEEDGAISFNKDQTSWSLIGKIPEIKLPDTIKEVVHARMSRLSENMRLVLEIASVLGEEFEYDTLAAVSKLDEEQLVTNLDDLIRFKIIIEQPTTFGQSIHYRFAHNKICEVIYNGLGQSHRRLLHAKTANAIEEKNKNDLNRVIYELAEHCYQAGDYKRSLRFASKAGDKALQGFAPEKAKTFYQWGLDFIELARGQQDEVDSDKMIHTEILLKLSDICMVIGEWDEALTHLQKLLSLSEDIGDERGKAKAYRNIGLIHRNRNEWEEAIFNFNEGLKISEKINDNQFTADFYHCLGTVHDEKVEFNEALKCYGKCMEISVNIGDSSGIGEAYLGIGRIHVRKGEYKETVEAFTKAVEIFQKTQELGYLSKAYANLGAVYNIVDLAKAIEYHNKSIEIADKTKNVRIKGYALMNLASNFLIKNDLKTAARYLDDALEIFEKLGERMAISTAYENYGSIYRRRRNWDKATDYFERALNICEELALPYNLGDILYESGLMYKDKGDIPEAHERLKRALDIFQNLQNEVKIKKVEKELNSLKLRS